MGAPRRERALGEKEYSLRCMEAGDVGAALALTANAPEAAQWSRGNYERASRGDFDAWVATTAGEFIGFVVARRMADEVEILNLAVERTHRRCGVATRLVAAALEFARARGAQRAFLEVRESNTGAIAFYEGQGFIRTGRRARYYAHPPENALVLSRQLGGVSV